MRHMVKFFIHLFCLVALQCILSSIGIAQSTGNTTEPPIPVYYFVNPEDSLKAIANSPALVKRIDSLDTRLTEISKDNSTHQVWLFSIIVVLGAVNIFMLVALRRLRKELLQMKHIESERQFTTATPEPISMRQPEIQSSLSAHQTEKKRIPKRSKSPSKRVK
jgi:hypothetical protein